MVGVKVSTQMTFSNRSLFYF